MGWQGCTGSQVWDEELQQCVVPTDDEDLTPDVPNEDSSGIVWGMDDEGNFTAYNPNQNEWQFQGLDLNQITPSWNVSEDFINQGGIHTYDSEGIIEWLANQGFGDDQEGDATAWFIEEFGSLGDILAFDQSQIDELGIGFAMQEEAMQSEFDQWQVSANTMLDSSIENFQTLASQQLEAFNLSNEERIRQERMNAADLRRSALQGLATTRRASARSGISSGMGSTKALDNFLTQSREQAITSRAAQDDYLSQITSTEEQRDFNIEQAEMGYENQLASQTLANENTLEQMQYDFTAQASSAYESWYQNLIGMTGAYFQDTSFGDMDFDLFGTGG